MALVNLDDDVERCPHGAPFDQECEPCDLEAQGDDDADYDISDDEPDDDEDDLDDDDLDDEDLDDLEDDD
jgi:hypothetical protein